MKSDEYLTDIAKSICREAEGGRSEVLEGREKEAFSSPDEFQKN